MGTIADAWALHDDAAHGALRATPEAQLHQHDDILAFAVLERAYDRTPDALESVSIRLGVLIAVQAAIEALLID